MFHAVKGKVAEFRRSEDGWVTFESVLWVPILVSIFVMIADVSIVFMNKARIERILQDGHRGMAVGLIADCPALENWLVSNITAMAPSASATCSTNLTQTTTRIQAPVGELDLTGATGILAGLTIRVESVHHAERGT